MSELIGVFGGTFSPPHKGHVHAARVFCEALGLRELLVIPTSIPPHKSYEEEVSGEDRLAMCRLAFAGIPGARVSDMEIRRGGKSYTADTVAELTAAGYRIAMLIGTDMMLTLDKWNRSPYIFEHTDLYCVRRESDSYTDALIEQKNKEYLREYGKNVTLLHADAYTIASTDIRERIKRGEPLDMLPDEVADYIQERGLYR